MRRMRGLVVCVAVLLMTAPLHAADDILAKLVDRFIMPHYQALSLTADAQE